MSRSINFFATCQDLESLLSTVEQSFPLRYYPAGTFVTAEQEYWDSGLALPNLGTAQAGDSNLVPFFLVVKGGTSVRVQEIPQRRGGVRYGIDQSLNPASVAFRPGGVFENAVIAGDVGTCTVDPLSTDLFQRFARAIRRQFTSIEEYYVGKEAVGMLDAGQRLTASVRSPKDCDLSRR